MKEKNVKNERLCVGINSNILDTDKHIPMFDYDKPEGMKKDYFREIVISELCYLREKYKLSDIYVIETNKGYNAFTLDMLYLIDVINILCDSCYIDKNFRNIGMERNYYTLTMSYDKKFCQMLTSTYESALSYPHYRFFDEIMEYPILEKSELLNKRYDGISLSFYFKENKGVYVNK